MKISYAICVCDEYKELKALLAFLEEVRNKNNSEIVILVDTTKVSDDVSTFVKNIPNVYYRSFNNDFSDHKNFLNSKCQGEYIFNIDADEIPQESLIRLLETYKGEAELLYIPRINICPGYTKAFLNKWKFHANVNGWINWPDYQGRFYKNGLSWVGKVHEKIETEKAGQIPSTPEFALWHVKSTQRQNRQNEFYEHILN